MAHPLRARPGSVLILLAVIVFVFAAASVLFASGQLLHAKRLGADHGKLQAIYAAEAGVFASFEARRAFARTAFVSEDGFEAAYETQLEGTAPPYWIASHGTATLSGQRYEATVRGYVAGNQIVLWDF